MTKLNDLESKYEFDEPTFKVGATITPEMVKYIKYLELAKTTYKNSNDILKNNIENLFNCMKQL